MNRITIIKYEKNIIRPSIEILQELAAVFKISYTLLYDDYYLFLDSDFGHQIKLVRKNLKLTQLEFGKLLKLHKKTIERWENYVQAPSINCFKKIRELVLGN